MEITPHSEKQDIAIFSDKSIVACLTGIQWGKTRVGAIRTKIYMHRFTKPDDTFLVLAPTYKIMQQSTLPAFLQIMDGYGDYSKGNAEFKMHGGGTAYMRTGTDPDSIVGATNVRHIWGDEAGKFSLYFWENMQARAAFKEAPICLTTSPYTLNWIFKEIIRPKMKGRPRKDVELIQARSDENPYFPLSRYESARETMDPRRFRMMFGGAWEKMEGLVYDCFDEELNQCEPFTLPAGTKVVAGVDWGFTNPFAMTFRAITPDGLHYQIGEVYRTGLTISGMVDVAKKHQTILGIKMFYCDPSAPAYVEEFNRAGLSAVGANNNIRLGIDLHYQLIKERKLKFFRGRNKYSIDEIESYRYPDPNDPGVDGDIKELNPVKQNDHLADSARYITIHTYSGHTAKPEIVSDSKEFQQTSDPYEVIKKVRMTDFAFGDTEDWS